MSELSVLMWVTLGEKFNYLPSLPSHGPAQPSWSMTDIWRRGNREKGRNKKKEVLNWMCVYLRGKGGNKNRQIRKKRVNENGMIELKFEWEEINEAKQETQNIKMHFHENIIWHSPFKPFVLDGGLKYIGITSRKHDYWKLFGFMRHQIKFQTNRSPHPSQGSGLLKTYFSPCKSLYLLHFTQHF